MSGRAAAAGGGPGGRAVRRAGASQRRRRPLRPQRGRGGAARRAPPRPPHPGHRGRRARAVARRRRRAGRGRRRRGGRAARGQRAPPGRRRRGRPVPLRGRRTTCSPGPAPLIVALDEVQDPQNLGAICRTAECAGADGVVICERRAAHVTAAVARRRRARSSTCAIARVRNLADFLLAARDAGRGRTARRPARAPSPYTEPDWTRRGRCSCSARREGPAPARRGRVRRAGRAATARPDRVAERQRRRRRPAVRDLANATIPLDSDSISLE